MTSWRHKRTGNFYTIMARGNSEMKHPDTGEWLPAVFYTPDYSITMQVPGEIVPVYCQAESAFAEKFEEVEE